jgi:nitroreductase
MNMPEATPLDQMKHATTDLPVNDLLLKRWSPRAFAETPVSDEDLKTIFTAAVWAASSYNEQPWRFVLGRKGDATWEKIFNTLMPMNQAWAKAAPVLYATFAKKTFSHNGSPNGVAVHDVGATSATASLQATALGLHTHGMAGFDRDALRAAFSVPDDFEPVACWALGYLGDPETLVEQMKQMELAARSRKPLGAVVFSEWEKAAL